MTTPNTEPIPATDAEIARIKAITTLVCFDCGCRNPGKCEEELPKILARIEQEREIRRELAEALKNLVTVNQDWNAAVEETIGRPPYWTDTYLDAARDILARAAKMEENNVR